MQEVFKAIKGYEGLYQVSNTGKVKSLVNNIILKTVKRKAAQTQYEYLTLVKDKVKTTKIVHRLVASAFIPNPENKPCVNHLDNNGLNNNATNLEWCTYSENLIHAQKQGRLYEAQAKGGIVTSKKVAEAAKIDAASMVDKIYGYWHVVELLGLQDVGYLGIMRYKFNCKCTKCGGVKVLSREYLKTEPRCRTCAAVDKIAVKYKEIVNNITNTTINNWLVLEVTPPIKTTKTCKLHVSCIKCGHKTYVPYAALKSKKQPIKSCKNCDG